jgi:hypothetical protein
MNRRKIMVLLCHGDRGIWKGRSFTFAVGGDQH